MQLYTMSAAMDRGMLQHDHGVDLSTISWVQGAIDGPGSHGSPTVLPLLKQPDLVNNDSDKSLNQMLEDGEIDAILSAMMPESFGRNPDIVRLFPNFREVEADYYRRTKLFPLMHLVVIRRDVYDTNPEVAQSLYDAFCRAKDISLEHMKYTGALRYMLPFLPADLDEIEDVFDGDPWPYGIETNRTTLEAEVQYMVEQHHAKAISIEERSHRGSASGCQSNRYRANGCAGGCGSERSNAAGIGKQISIAVCMSDHLWPNGMLSSCKPAMIVACPPEK